MKYAVLIALIKMRLKSIVFILACGICGMAFAFIHSVPKSESQFIEGVIISKGTYQGLESSGDKLVVETDAGRTATVSISNQPGIRVNDRVLLSTYDRYLLGPKYQFVKIVR